ncbi:hypothetical protein IFM47457_02702 [Aspergillus lentulus]|nr:hypothetical protein IFM47457_02702 [Aspergillus lentulus]
MTEIFRKNNLPPRAESTKHNPLLFYSRGLHSVGTQATSVSSDVHHQCWQASSGGLETRASSLLSAVRFAKRWRLSGIDFASETLISCPVLVVYVKQSGLIGADDLLTFSKAQAAAGIDILMADRVRLVSGALRDGGYL